MDDKLSKALKEILANLCVEYAEKNEVTFSDWLPQIEQAFRDADWVEPQQLAERPCPFERIRDYPDCYEDCPDTDACPISPYNVIPYKRQQPKGELVNACKGCSVEGIQPGCSEEDKNKCDRWDLAKAQLAHDLARMVKLPSEDME